MQWAVENATLDWLVRGRVTSLSGSEVGLLGVLSFKSGPVLFFAPGSRIFGNSYGRGFGIEEHEQILCSFALNVFLSLHVSTSTWNLFCL